MNNYLIVYVALFLDWNPGHRRMRHFNIHIQIEIQSAKSKFKLFDICRDFAQISPTIKSKCNRSESASNNQNLFNCNVNNKKCSFRMQSIHGICITTFYSHSCVICKIFLVQSSISVRIINRNRIPFRSYTHTQFIRILSLCIYSPISTISKHTLYTDAQTIFRRICVAQITDSMHISFAKIYFMFIYNTLN